MASQVFKTKAPRTSTQYGILLLNQYNTTVPGLALGLVSVSGKSEN